MYYFIYNLLTRCQHGSEECYVDRLEGCVINFVPSPAQYSVFMSCFEGEQQNSVTYCAQEAGFDSATTAKITSCAAPGSLLGNSIESANARATVKLGQSKLGTPWVLINGQQLEDTDTLLQSVCNAYKGKLPAGCH